jgi:hypothetical protein
VAWYAVEVRGALWPRVGASLDEAAAAQLGRMLDERQERQALLVVDLRPLNSVDAGALTVIVRARRRPAVWAAPSPCPQSGHAAAARGSGPRRGGDRAGQGGTWRPWGAVLVA